MKTLFTIFIIGLTLITAGGQAAPVSGHNSSPDNSTDAAITTNITVLQTKAKSEIVSVFQEISLLEKHTVSYHSYIAKRIHLSLYMYSFSYINECSVTEGDIQLIPSELLCAV